MPSELVSFHLGASLGYQRPGVFCVLVPFVEIEGRYEPGCLSQTPD